MIPFENFTAKLREICDRDPLRQSYCEYFDEDTGAPVCPIGHAFHELGVRIPNMLNGVLAHHMNWTYLGFSKPTEDQVSWVDNLQIGVDGDYPWGLALMLADKPDVEAMA